MFWCENNLSFVNKKTHLTKPQMIKNGEKQKDRNVDKEWQNDNKK
jgi:hypothetical protein